MKKRITGMLVALALTVAVSANMAFADYYSANTVLYYGMQSSQVTNLQNDLKRLGYFNYQATGYFGSATAQSVTQFQKDNSLQVDGIVGHQTAREIKADKVLQTAKQYMGVPYVWGGVSPSGFDCSGFTQYVLLENGITVPRSADQQYTQGASVSRDQLKPGDMVFFTTYKPGASHVGFYIGNNQFIHASSGAEKVIISDLDNVYYSQHYIGARRLI